MRSVPDFGTLRAAWWAERSLRLARRRLRREPLALVSVAPPPALPGSALRGVEAVLLRRDPSCLERSLILQRWHAAHGVAHDIVIGVTAPAQFSAHAWLDGEPDAEAGPFFEIARLRP
jgi:hypothetical protein